LPGSGLTVEVNPLSLPNRSAALRGRTPRWKCPIMSPYTKQPLLKLFNSAHPACSRLSGAEDGQYIAIIVSAFDAGKSCAPVLARVLRCSNVRSLAHTELARPSTEVRWRSVQK
jgi:hypothetical protein